MPKRNLSLPHERRKASLKSQELKLRVRQAETKEALTRTREELRAMSPKPPKSDV